MNHRYKYCKPLLDGQTAPDDDEEEEAEFERVGAEFEQAGAEFEQTGAEFEERRSLNEGCAA